MSIWFEAEIQLNTQHVDPSKNPIQALQQIFKKHGFDFNRPYSEGYIKQIGRKGIIQISICNPDSVVDTIHLSLKEIKHLPFVCSIRITQHHY